MTFYGKRGQIMELYSILLQFRPDNGILDQIRSNNGILQQIRPNNGILQQIRANNRILQPKMGFYSKLDQMIAF
jgi:hypothetical protein